MKYTLKSLFLAAEADPFVKIGGLGDVAGSLPLALKNLTDSSKDDLEIDIRLVLPYHGAIQRRGYPLQNLLSFTIHSENGDIPIDVLQTQLKGMPVYLIASPIIQPDGSVYSSDTLADGYKFTLFSVAGLELARQMDWRPDIVHANDWHTSPALYALYSQPADHKFFEQTARILSIHNLPYMGLGAGPSLAAFNLLPAYHSDLPRWAQDVPLALGLLSADRIVTVSPSYAQEILTPEFSSGLHYFLSSHQNHISGILNGLDIECWNPENDSLIKVNYGIENLSQRAGNKAALQAELNLPVDPDIPLMAIVSRMDHQKGIDLVFPALHQLSDFFFPKKETWQLIILGTGNPALETMAQQLESVYPRQVRAMIRFDSALSHRIYAGADILLIPSRYEPCGITQMIAMRYGCIPVARATGGLRDTIIDYGQSKQFGNGFLFERADASAFEGCLERALGCFAKEEVWRSLQRRGMKTDFSWERSAREYLALYRSLVNLPVSGK